MGSSSSKFKKYLQHGDEYAAMQVYQSSPELRRDLDPNSRNEVNDDGRDSSLFIKCAAVLRKLLGYVIPRPGVTVHFEAVKLQQISAF